MFVEFGAASMVRNVGTPKVELSMLDASEKFLSKSHYYAPSPSTVAVNHCVLEGEDFFFKAVNQVVKALMFDVKRTCNLTRKLPQYALMLFYPIIVIEGSMFEYMSGGVHLTKYVQYQSEGISRYEEPFIVDVVEKGLVPDFLNMLRKEHDSIQASISRQIVQDYEKLGHRRR